MLSVTTRSTLCFAVELKVELRGDELNDCHQIIC